MGQEESGSKAGSTPRAASEAAADWSEIEVTAADLAQHHPPLAQLLGSDVCVMAAAYPTYALSRDGAIGWRGLVTHTLTHTHPSPHPSPHPTPHPNSHPTPNP